MKLIEMVNDDLEAQKIAKEIKRLADRMTTPGIAPSTMHRLLDEKRNLKFRTIELVRKGMKDLLHVWEEAFDENLDTSSAQEIINRRK